MGRRVAVHDVFALLDKITFLNRDVLALWHHVFHGLQAFIRRLDRDPALVLVVATKAHVTIDFGDDCVIFRAPGLEQFRHPWQTTGDVLGLGAFARDPCKHVTGLDLLTVFDRQDRIHRHGVFDRVAVIQPHGFTICARNQDFRLQFIAFRRRTPIRDDLLRHAGGVIGLIPDRQAGHKIDKLHGTVFFGDDRQCVGVPLVQLVPTHDLGAILDHQVRSIGQLVLGTFQPVLVDHRDFHVPTHDDLIAVGVLDQVRIAVFDFAFLRRFLERLAATLGNTADVEGPHGQLCARLANRLCRDNADGLTGVDLGSARQVTTVTLCTDPVLGLTCQRRPDLEGCHIGIVDHIGQTLVDQRVALGQNLARCRVKHVLSRDPAQNTL